jgi:hypothetical protein
VQQGYHEQEDYASLRELLNSPKEDVKVWRKEFCLFLLKL